MSRTDHNLHSWPAAVRMRLMLKRRPFSGEIILVCVRAYCIDNISHRTWWRLCGSAALKRAHPRSRDWDHRHATDLERQDSGPKVPQGLLVFRSKSSECYLRINVAACCVCQRTRYPLERDAIGARGGVPGETTSGKTPTVCPLSRVSWGSRFNSIRPGLLNKSE